ncbi:hypothetical protein DFQ28_004895 [Apophysomyces sp. BC1034]|nr:hypothetical protein DFQ30_004839 [Apophysomyces sp. BC1015]KAG0178161.1 hypothetical protein DFQ29_003838 [Apophysomyces sp. BC1021]KAG0188407.1 hypothetical protein DFQ28_004895 [Apophysomyces sp. BC1034]
MTLRELKIKTNVVSRIYKEHLAYGKEMEYQQKRIDKLIAENADEADQEVLQETVQMIPDVKQRLIKAYQDLQDKVEDPEYANSTELADALAVLSNVEAYASEGN